MIRIITGYPYGIFEVNNALYYNDGLSRNIDLIKYFMTLRIENFEPGRYQIIFKALHGDPNACRIPDVYSNPDQPVRAYVTGPLYFQIWEYNGRQTPPIMTGELHPTDDGGTVIFKNGEQHKLSNAEPVSLISGAPEITFGAVRRGCEQLDENFRFMETGIHGVPPKPLRK